MELFHEKGYSSTTVEDIAKTAEISTRTFFRYFPSKRDIVVEEVWRHLGRLRERVRVTPRRYGLIEAVEIIAREHADYLEGTAVPEGLLPLWRDEPDLRRRRLEVLHVECPQVLAEDFATREGVTTPRAEHVLAARMLMAFLVEAAERDGPGETSRYNDRVDLLLRTWHDLWARWIGPRGAPCT